MGRLEASFPLHLAAEVAFLCTTKLPYHRKDFLVDQNGCKYSVHEKVSATHCNVLEASIQLDLTLPQHHQGSQQQSKGSGSSQSTSNSNIVTN
jgi:hypothetical protein